MLSESSGFWFRTNPTLHGVTFAVIIQFCVWLERLSPISICVYHVAAMR